MLPGIHVEQRPGQIHIYARGTEGTGAIPGIGATFNVPLFTTGGAVLSDNLNPADGSIAPEVLLTGTHGERRMTALWFFEVWLFQDGPATLQLLERPPIRYVDTTNGVANSMRFVWTRRARANVPFRQRWHGHAADVRLTYTNGATSLTTFAMDVIGRAA